MTQASSGPISGRTTIPARSNLYTVLLLVSALALGIGAGFVWYKSTQLFNESNPFHIERDPT